MVRTIYVKLNSTQRARDSLVMKEEPDKRVTFRMPGTLVNLLLLTVWATANEVPFQERLKDSVMDMDMDTPSVPLSPRTPRVGGRPTSGDFLQPDLPFSLLRQGTAAARPDGDQPRDTGDGRRRASKWKGSRVVVWSKLMPNPQGFLALYG
ncbi:uncharacterized protein LOC118408682 isoform X1 [Branchiostoma floridae]|uniref:Uncharacterized protein LOC118408682 isoform X1 n=2 Tax=Branchiostoma floridae TaxID=7739 RepID=A0A9J7HVT6_BRAFL|nr:uncharacterized protein LOC118408682 isoform X1 [Branchiostoma floridae]